MSAFDINLAKSFFNKDNLIIFDIGAFDFWDSIALKSNFPNSKVFAFEAFKDNIKKYSKSAIQKGIIVNHLAISDKEGEITFYNSISLNGSSWTCSGSILPPRKEEGVTIHPGLKYNREGIKVKTTTIEKFCEENYIENIDIIHMDIQGAEYYAIKGLGEKIRPKLVFCETCEYKSYENSLTREDLDELMFSLGYKIHERLIYDTLYVLN